MTDVNDQIEHYRLRLAELSAHASQTDAPLIDEMRRNLDELQASFARPLKSEQPAELINSISDGIFALDRDWRLTYINQRAAGEMGMVPEDLLGEDFWQKLPVVLNSDLEKELRRVMETGQSHHIEFQSPSRRWYMANIYPTSNGISVYFLDKTAQKQAEERRDESITALGRLVETSAHILAAKTWAEILEESAEAALKLTAASEALAFYRAPDGSFVETCTGDLQGALTRQPLAEDQREQIMSFFSRQGSVRLNREQARAAPNEWNLLEDTNLLGSSLAAPGGQSVGALLVAGKQDGGFTIEEEYLLTQLAQLTALALQNVQAVEQVRSQSAELDTIFTSASDALIVYDRQGRLLRANPAAGRLFGGLVPRMDPTITENIPELRLYTEDGQPITPSTLPVHQSIHNGQGTGWIRLYCQLPDGRQLELNASASPLINPDGEFHGVVTVWHDVSDMEQSRRRAEQEANRAGVLAQELNSIFAAMADSVMVFDQQGNPVRLNPTARDLYDFDVVQTPLEETMTRINLRRLDGTPYGVEELPSRRALRGELVMGERAIQTRTDGSDIIILSSAAPVYDSSGKVTGSVVVWHDISESERMMQEYQHQRRLLERIIERAPVGIALLVGPDYRFALANPVLNSISQGKGDFLGRPAAEVWPELAPQIRPILDQVYRSGEAYQVENMLVRVEEDSGPAEYYFSFTYTPLLGSNGRTESILVLLTETTVQVQNRVQLERERAFLQGVIEYAPLGIVFCDPQARVLSTNPAADRIYHRPVPYEEDLNSHASMLLCYPDGSPYDPRQLPLTRSALDGETVRDLDMAILWPDGQRRDLRVNSAPIKDAIGQVLGAVGVFEDFTSRRREEKQDQFLAEISQSLLALTGENEICELVTRRLREHLRASRVVLFEVDTASGQMRIHQKHRRSLSPFPAELALEDISHPALALLKLNASMVYADASTEERLGDLRGQMEELGFRSAVLLPRRGDGTWEMSLNVGCIEPRAWQLDEVALIHSVADLTWLALQRSRLTGALRASERRYRRLFDSNMMGVTYSQFTGPVLDANDAFLAITGYTRKDLETRKIDWRSLTPPEYLSLDTQAVAESMERGFCTPFEKEYIRKDGSRVPVLIGFSPLDESASEFVCFVLDVSQQQQYREALRESQRRLEIALKGAPVSMYTQDRNLRYTWVYNLPPVFSERDFIGHTSAENFRPEDAALLDGLKRQVLQSGTGLRQDVTLDLKGEMHIFDMVIEPQRDEKGTVNGVAAVAMDVTERYLIEAEIRHKAALVEVQRTILQHREQERMQIARDLHDGLLQELVGISFGLSEMSRERLEENQAELLVRLQDSLARQIHDLRVFCSDLRPPALAPFGVERALTSFIQTYQERNPDLEVYLDLMHDGTSLGEIVRLVVFRVGQELLNNVARHARASQVWLSFQFNSYAVRLEVKDDGQGFLLPDRWIYLAHEGHFGLVGIQERVEAVNGKVEIDSAPGKGTRVAITIPVQNNPAIDGTIEL